jgi:hypothetical protein
VPQNGSGGPQNPGSTRSHDSIILRGQIQSDNCRLLELLQRSNTQDPSKTVNTRSLENERVRERERKRERMNGGGGKRERRRKKGKDRERERG